MQCSHNVKNSRQAIVIVSTGGIAKISDIPQFLLGMFTDKRILPYSRPVGFLLAVAIIALRWPKTYSILKRSGPSPVIFYTRSIVKKLKILLKADLFFAMRYTKPKIAEIVNELTNYEKIFIVSLLPQFSYTTVGSFMDKFEKVSKKSIRIDTFYKDKEYIDIVGQKIEDAIEKIPEHLRKEAVLLFSAHSLPISLAEKTKDPYIKQVKESVELTAKRFPKHRYELAFQSKLGPAKWFNPTSADKVTELAKKHLPIVMVPISFVVDNSETIYEIDLLYKALAEKWGASYFVRADCINDDDRFVELIAKRIREKINDL
ncbi:MAG: ferrochelatase [Epsilonproteobacteria bacterium]|nr:ferrochelatase [Campylobacterota bacterium]